MNEAANGNAAMSNNMANGAMGNAATNSLVRKTSNPAVSCHNGSIPSVHVTEVLWLMQGSRAARSIISSERAVVKRSGFFSWIWA